MQMKRTVVVVSLMVLVLSAFSFGEDHAEQGGTAPRRTVLVPKLNSEQRADQLVSACLVGRPFPPREMVQIPEASQAGGGSQEAAPIAPAETSALQQDSTSIPQPSGSSSIDGRGVLEANCTSCHHSGQSPEFFKGKASDVEDRLNLPESDPRHMPQGKSLSAEDKTAIINWVNGR